MCTEEQSNEHENSQKYKKQKAKRLFPFTFHRSDFSRPRVRFIFFLVLNFADCCFPRRMDGTNRNDTDTHTDRQNERRRERAGSNGIDWIARSPKEDGKERERVGGIDVRSASSVTSVSGAGSSCSYRGQKEEIKKKEDLLDIFLPLLLYHPLPSFISTKAFASWVYLRTGKDGRE